VLVSGARCDRAGVPAADEVVAASGVVDVSVIALVSEIGGAGCVADDTNALDVADAAAAAAMVADALDVSAALIVAVNAAAVGAEAMASALVDTAGVATAVAGGRGAVCAPHTPDVSERDRSTRHTLLSPNNDRRALLPMLAVPAMREVR
jgi:hypothetical protein